MTCGLRFTERMVGWFAFGEHDYLAGARRGQASGTAIEFHLTIATPDVDAMVADPTHAAVPQGYVQSDALGGRSPVVDGRFNLFVDAGDTTRHMLYCLHFADGTGRPLTLAGYKDVRPGPLHAVWPETSTLYTRVLAGHVDPPDGASAVTDGVVGSGILHIRPLDFARQLTTFRTTGPSWAARARALDAFGALFLTELWQVFDPLRRSGRRG